MNECDEHEKNIEKLLALYGWEVECWSPFEIRTRDGSFATGEAASCVLHYIKNEHDKSEMPEPCKSMPHDGQKEVTIGGKTFMADLEMIPLLEELNKVGLKTYSHCYGHEGKHAWFVVWAKNLDNVELRKHPNGEQQLLIGWERD